MLNLEDIKKALSVVKLPGAKADIVESGQLVSVDIQESSIVMDLKIGGLNPTLEKSLRYQIDKALKVLKADLSYAVNFAAEDSSAPKIATILAVASGKGGVGKSATAVNLAAALQMKGYRVGILDCDIYGPSVPTMLGVVDQKPMMLNGKVQPIEAHGFKIMSAGFFVEPGQGIVWRGPMIHKLIQQFYKDVDWGILDVLVVDLPPGTGDAPLSLAQTLPITGAVMVSMPAQISLIDVHKSISMFNQVKIPILGIVENMSIHKCSSCGHEEAIFDRGQVKEFSKKLGLSFLGEIPIDGRIRRMSDEGRPFLFEYKDSPAGQAFVRVAERIEPFLKTADDDSQDALKIVM